MKQKVKKDLNPKFTKLMSYRTALNEAHVTCVSFIVGMDIWQSPRF